MQERVQDAHWSLGMALAWIICRTDQAVTNVRRWAPGMPAIRDLLSHLRAGKLIARGMFKGELITHPIDAAEWATLEIVVKRMIFAGPGLFLAQMPIAIARSLDSSHTPLLRVTLPKVKIRKLWPPAKLAAAAETQCREHLVAEMQRYPDRAPRSKPRFLADLQAAFQGLSKRGFNRAWSDAINQTGTLGWRKAGRRRKSSQ